MKINIPQHTAKGIKYQKEKKKISDIFFFNMTPIIANSTKQAKIFICRHIDVHRWQPCLILGSIKLISNKTDNK